ncbi:MAG: transposase [Ignavibacteriaceae bacterium]
MSSFGKAPKVRIKCELRYNCYIKIMGRRERKPNRLKPYDYSLAGYYFLTICVFKRKELFGGINNAKMKLNKFGTLVKHHLELLGDLYEYIEIDYSIIMPDHIHLILINRKNKASISRNKMVVSKIIQQFKSSCNKDIRRIPKSRQRIWQKSFYDRIIRNERELYLIRKYISENPLKWEYEKNYPENLYM